MPKSIVNVIMVLLYVYKNTAVHTAIHEEFGGWGIGNGECIQGG